MPTPARPRRLRRTGGLRRLVRETRLDAASLVQPLFVRPGDGVERAVSSMPGVSQFSVDRLVGEAGACAAAGVGAVLLFGIPEAKDATGSGAYAPGGIVPTAIRALKRAHPDLVVVADVCLCEYTDHGHCGVVRGDAVDNEATLPLLAKAAVAYAAAGADVVAPSAMMDGQVAAIRAALDSAGHAETAILAYAAKYASALYGPFREAAESPPQFGDRRGYQMDPANVREALREVRLDVAEGADMVMVKPALPYLDVLAAVRAAVDVPVAAYQVSGEYSMIAAAADRGWIDLERTALETLSAIRRAGADLVITYFAKRLAPLLG